ncbi:MAG: membrane-bound PQQ-dependent dehydrogenase, glucose/quinate/shikimate family [Dehalococcoidia bacterium]
MNKTNIAQEQPAPGGLIRWLRFGLVGVLVLVGASLMYGGAQLAWLGGSWYYGLAGAGWVITGLLLARGDRRAFGLFAGVFAGTVGWALWEAGVSFWPQVPRLAPFLVLGAALAALCSVMVAPYRRMARRLAMLQVAILCAGFVAMFVPQGSIYPVGTSRSDRPTSADAIGVVASQWRYYGRDSGATHHVPYEQIGHGNVGDLEVAWTFRTGEINDSADFQATPLQIGDRLFLCTAHNKILALDADSGTLIWSFDPKVEVRGTWNRCRGVGYFDVAEAEPATAAVAAADTACRTRVMATTIDARLLALDATSGHVCSDFGDGGVVDLTAGLGSLEPGWYYPTSAPLVAKGRVIVGGWVSDNQSIDEPGGVVRAFDAVTGRLVWAWDPGAKGPAGSEGDSGTYTRSTPNFWGTATYDDVLGLVYVPTGNGAPDHWGAGRTPETDRFSTSVVALSIDTGRVVWHFQTVHHDLWDYDLSAPPTFVDLPNDSGGTTPALVQVGKAGQIFVLDRRTGVPVARVEERPVPRGALPGERVSPTQPFSTQMPQVIPTTLSEKTMWGATFLDQLECRIQFRILNFQGQYTPPSLVDTAISPGYLGGMNWGGVSIDKGRGVLVVNDIRLATIVRLVPQQEAADRIQANFSHAGYELHPSKGAPYAVELKSFLSVLGLPCEQPPWGMVSAIDLRERKVLWQIPAGTAAEDVAEKIGVHAPIPIGMPTVSAALTTATGLTFYAGARDPYIRAWDTTSGRELWKARLPVGSQATPMSYVSPRTGRQYVVVAAGGAPYAERIGDYVIAFALPR